MEKQIHTPTFVGCASSFASATVTNVAIWTLQGHPNVRGDGMPLIEHEESVGP